MSQVRGRDRLVGTAPQRDVRPGSEARASGPKVQEGGNRGVSADVAHDTAPLWWAEAVRLKDTMKLKDLAEHLGVRVGLLASELRKAGVARATPSEVGVEVPAARRGSQDERLLRVFHLLGTIPDSDVARESGVSIRTIASFRARHNIPGYSGPRRRPEVRGRGESKLDDHTTLLGALPDRVVAEMLNMSLGAVRNYRVKHGIGASGRMSADRIAERRAAVEAPKKAPAPQVELAQSGIAWRVRLGGPVERAVVLVAATMAEALQRAESLATGDVTVMAVERLGPLLAPSA